MPRLRSLLCVLLALLLSACSNKPSVDSYGWPPGATRGVIVGGFAGGAAGAAIGGTGAIPLGIVLGAILGGTVGAITDQSKATQALSDAGIQVIQLGDIVQVVIPVDLMFEPTETTLMHSALPLLDQIVAVLTRFCNTRIQVIGHTDIVGTNAEQVTFSKLQAQAIVTYLWTHGIALNRMRFIGVGMHDDDATFNSAFGNGYNRRVEIMFWRTANNTQGCSNLAGRS